MIKKKTNFKNRGFTLIELLVVVAIIGLLSSVVMASLNSARAKARDAKRIAELSQIRTALELFYNDKGYYPQASCGWDCNGYRYSFNSSWDSLASDLAPYIKTLPKDPINSACAPWNTNCFSYAYGNVGKGSITVNNPTGVIQYDLTAQLEDSNNPQRCAVRLWRFYFSNTIWCGSYSSQIYEASN
jgi:type II secretion system protein G